MKQLIVTAAILPILLAFVVQFTSQSLLHSRIVKAESAIHAAKIMAESDGGFTSKNEANLRRELADAMKVSSSEIVLELERTPDIGDKSISYRIIVPTGKIITAGKLFGISDSRNKASLVSEGSIPNIYYYIEKYKPEEPVEKEEPKEVVEKEASEKPVDKEKSKDATKKEGANESDVKKENVE